MSLEVFQPLFSSFSRQSASAAPSSGPTPGVDIGRHAIKAVLIEEAGAGLRVRFAFGVNFLLP